MEKISNEIGIKKNEELKIENANIAQEGLDNLVVEKLATKKETSELPSSTKESKISILKERIMNAFKTKRVSEMTDPVKISTELENDIRSLKNFEHVSTGVGFGMGVGGSYKDYVEKYNIGQNLFAEIKDIQNKLKEMDKKSDSILMRESKTNNLSDEKIALNNEIISLRKELNQKNNEFCKQMQIAVEQRIRELEQKEAA